MTNPVMTWLKIGVIFELLGAAVTGLLWVLDVLKPADAQDVLIKGSLAIAVLTVAGAGIGALMGAKQPADAPKP